MNLLSYVLDPAHWVGPTGIAARLGEHLLYTVLSLAVAAVISLLVGTLVGHFRFGNLLLVGTSNATRAIPTLGLLVLVVTLLGTGIGPVVLALTLLAVPPVLNATATGVREADAQAVQAARALGMTPWQVITRVELPLALPLIVSGLRSASLQVVSTATVAALAASGGLGRLVVDGQRAGPAGYPQMFAGAVLVAALAIVLDIGFGVIGAVARRAQRPGGRSTLDDRTVIAPRPDVPQTRSS